MRACDPARDYHRAAWELGVDFYGPPPRLRCQCGARTVAEMLESIKACQGAAHYFDPLGGAAGCQCGALVRARKA